MPDPGKTDIEQAQNPNGQPGDLAQVTMWTDDLKFVMNNLEWKFELLFAVRRELSNPLEVWEAWRTVKGREVYGFCYLLTPLMVPDEKLKDRPLLDSEIVTAFTRPNFVLIDWRLELVQERDGILPNSAEWRFGERLYTRGGAEEG